MRHESHAAIKRSPPPVNGYLRRTTDGDCPRTERPVDFFLGGFRRLMGLRSQWLAGASRAGVGHPVVAVFPIAVWYRRQLVLDGVHEALAQRSVAVDIQAPAQRRQRGQVQTR